MDTELNEEEKERLQDIIESYGSEYDFYIAIYLQHLRHAGYEHREEFPRSSLPLKVLKEEADKWSLRLHDGWEIPAKKYNIIYEYLDYLAGPESGEIHFYWPW